MSKDAWLSMAPRINIPMWQSLLLLAGFVPLAVLLALVFLERWRRKRRGERSPLSEKLLRPAGHSLQRKLEDLNEAFDTWFIGTFLCSLLAVGSLPFAPADTIGRTIFLIVFGLGTAGCTVMAWRTLLKLRTHRLGLLGEQAMAELLQRLLPLGYQVFHDVPGDGKWNIDHVVVGPAGVFAIETKYRTKRPGKAGGPDHEAIFDGNTIQYPSGYRDAKAPEQTNRNARWLATMLSKATRERVIVRPILALPGWLVTLKVNSELKVLSGRYVSDFISSEPAQISDKAIQQISDKLEQCCRDVEF
jgi:Nuclease-related domain